MSEKKSQAGIIILVIIVLLTCGVFFLLKQTNAEYYLKSRFSQEPKMNCQIILNVDGKPYRLTEADVISMPMDSGQENTISNLISMAYGCKFSCRGGEYGSQPFQITLRYGDGKTAVIPVRIFVGANWEMSDVTLTLYADTAEETYSYICILVVNDETYTSSSKNTFDSQEFVSVSNI